MKTIEEINEIAPYHPLEWQQGYGIWQAGYMEGQKNGATEQKAIDIEKACEIYRKELSEIIGLFNHLGKELYDIDELGELISLEGSVKDFRKAMEESHGE